MKKTTFNFALLLVLLLFKANTFAQSLPVVGSILAGQTKNVLTVSSNGLTDNSALSITNSGPANLQFFMASSATATSNNVGISVASGGTVTATISQLGGTVLGNFLNVSDQSSLLAAAFNVSLVQNLCPTCPVPPAICVPVQPWVQGNSAASISLCSNYGFVGILNPSPQYPLDVNGTGSFEDLIVNHQLSTNYKARILNGLSVGTGDFSQIPFNGLVVSGQVGIGTTQVDDNRLTVNGTVNILGGKLFTTAGWLKPLQLNNGSAIQFNTTGSQFGIGASGGNSLYFFTAPSDAGSSTNIMQLYSNGTMGIGTLNMPDPAYKLAVNGTIRAKQVVVETGWSDFVFAKEYHLMSLSELEQYISQHHHLPEIPAAGTVEEKGADVGDLLKKQMQKIEELTLYVIEQNKQLAEQNKKIEELQKKVSGIEKK